MRRAPLDRSISGAPLDRSIETAPANRDGERAEQIAETDIAMAELLARAGRSSPVSSHNPKETKK